VVADVVLGAVGVRGVEAEVVAVAAGPEDGRRRRSLMGCPRKKETGSVGLLRAALHDGQKLDAGLHWRTKEARSLQRQPVLEVGCSSAAAGVAVAERHAVEQL
jgi:hypothetical protein